MYIEVEYNINKLKADWERIFLLNENLSPYQSFECNKFYFDTFYLAPSRIGLKPVFYKVVEDDDNVIIIPMIKKGKTLFDFCSFSSLDFWDVITPPPHHTHLNEVRIEKMIGYFIITLRNQGYRFVLGRMNYDSIIYKCLENNWVLEIEEKCGKILFSTYEAWYESLSKHMKQNLRTAYNKLARENININLRIYNQENWNENPYNKGLKEIYERRWQKKNNARFNFLKKILRRYSNPVNKLLENYSERLLFILCLNNKVAAFCSCVYRAKNLYIPRLAVDYENFKNYDTGTILISEILKTKQFDFIDLTRGGESYKFKLGCVEHFNFKCKI